jgi:hypothetical protein
MSRMKGLPRWAAPPILVALAIVAGACSPNVGAPHGLSVDNGTTLHVMIVVNGKQIDAVPPVTHRAIEAGALPPLPWKVQALSPTGRVLLTLDVAPGIVWETTDPNGVISQHGAATRVDLSCGRLDLYAGPPLLGGMPGPGVPGDCEP